MSETDNGPQIMYERVSSEGYELDPNGARLSVCISGNGGATVELFRLGADGSHQLYGRPSTRDEVVAEIDRMVETLNSARMTLSTEA